MRCSLIAGAGCDLRGGMTATYADLEAVPPHLVAEIIGGRLVTHPRPSPRRSACANAISGELTPLFQKGRGGPGGWWFFIEPEIRFGSDILVPDIAAWKQEHLTQYPDQNWFEIVPDWVCEVLSSSTERRDRIVKRQIYAEFGVPYLWLVDPRQQMLETFILAGADWKVGGTWAGDAMVRAPPFDAVAFSLADLWPLDRPLGFGEDAQALYAGDR